MHTREQMDEIIRRLEISYPDAACSLDFRADYELLFSVRLAAQCTDARVNLVTPTLFSTFPSLNAIAEADISHVEDIIRPTGFFRIKARDIVLCAQILLEKHGGKVPDTMESLLKLPGVGRKTANLILGDLFQKPAIVVDTHCIRLTNRIGLVDTKDPVKIEFQLRNILPPEKSNDFCHRMVLHGRAICPARSPKCKLCSIAEFCDNCKGQ